MSILCRSVNLQIPFRQLLEGSISCRAVFANPFPAAVRGEYIMLSSKFANPFPAAVRDEYIMLSCKFANPFPAAVRGEYII